MFDKSGQHIFSSLVSSGWFGWNQIPFLGIEKKAILAFLFILSTWLTFYSYFSFYTKTLFFVFMKPFHSKKINICVSHVLYTSKTRKSLSSWIANIIWPISNDMKSPSESCFSYVVVLIWNIKSHDICSLLNILKDQNK